MKKIWIIFIAAASADDASARLCRSALETLIKDRLLPDGTACPPSDSTDDILGMK